MEQPRAVTGYLTLPVRVGVLVVVAIAGALVAMPTDLRQTVLLRAAAYLGAFAPAILLAAAIGWLSFKRTWFLRSLAVLCGLTAIAIAVSGPIEQESYKNRALDHWASKRVKANEGEVTAFRAAKGQRLLWSDYEQCYFGRAMDGYCYHEYDGQVDRYPILPFKPPPEREFWELPSFSFR